MTTPALVLTGAHDRRIAFKQWTQITGLLTLRTFRLRYLRSRLGVGWALVQPVVQAAVLSLVFTKVFKISRVPHYTLYVLSGILTWQAFSAAVGTATTAAVDNAALLKKIAMPSVMFPISQVGSVVMVYLIQLFVLIFASGFSGTLSGQIVELPLLVVMTTATATAVGVLLCAFHVAFRDVKFFVESGLLILFYATPILYDPTQVPSSVRGVLKINPMYGVVQVARGALLDRHVDWGSVYLSMAEVAVLAVAGAFAYKVRSPDFADLV